MTVSMPLLKMAPPSAPALLPEKVLFVTVSVPLLEMPPPSLAWPLAMVRFWTVKLTPGFTEKMPALYPPLIVMRSPPMRLVFTLMVFRFVTVMVAGLGPQLNVRLPPAASATFNAASVQLAAVPVPTVV